MFDHDLLHALGDVTTHEKPLNILSYGTNFLTAGRAVPHPSRMSALGPLFDGSEKKVNALVKVMHLRDASACIVPATQCLARIRP
jgi:hypothetical protein